MTASLVLVEWCGFQPGPRHGEAGPLWLVRLLPTLLFLPQGIYLFWPLFYASQRACGREQGLTAAEWVWGLAWLQAVVFAGWVSWRYFSDSPDADALSEGMLVVYVVFAITVSAVALVIVCVDLIGGWSQPWTHVFGLVLMLWPAAPLAGVWLLNLKLR